MADLYDMSGLLGGAPPPQGGLLAPPPQMAQAAYQPPPRPGVNPVLGFFDNLLFNGAAQKAQQAGYESRATNAQQQFQYQQRSAYAAQLPPQERALFLNDPEGFLKLQEKLREPTNAAAGSTQFMNGVPSVAPLFDEKSGKWTTPNGATPSVGGDFVNGPGNSLVSARTGALQGTVTPPQNYPGTNSYDPMQVTGFGGPQDASAGAPQLGAPSPAGNPTAPRGIRNNNYTNLTALPGGQQWAGQTGVDKGGYVQFASPQDGINAAVKNLHTYATAHGINTVAGLVQRWAPAGAGNNTAAYTNFVAKQLGVDPNAKIDLTDPATTQKVIGALAAFENGPKAFAKGGPAPDLAASAPKLGGATPTSGNFPTGHVQGKVTQPITTAEIRNLGLGPGRYERQADGSLKQIAAPPANDLDYVKSLKEEASNASDYARLADQYDAVMRSPKSKGTGPVYGLPVVGGAIREGMAGFDPTLDTQENLGTQMATALRAPGMRLTQMEFQKFGQVSPNPENWANTNENLIQNARTLKALKADRATFFENYLYDHNTLNGAADQWQKIEDKKYGAQAAVPNGSPANAPKKSNVIRYDANGQRIKQ